MIGAESHGSRYKIAELPKDIDLRVARLFYFVMSEQMKIERKITVFFLSVLIAVVLTTCGGGGGGGVSAVAPPLIQATLVSFPTGSAPPGFLPPSFNSGAVVTVNDANGASISNARVTMNAAILTYNDTYKDYEGYLAVALGDSVGLSVTIGGNTYTASGTQFTTYPTISAPVAGAAWQASNTNIITWSEGAPLTNAFHMLGVLDAANLTLVWPTNDSFEAVPIGTLSYSIPANSLTAGNLLVFVGIGAPVNIPNAATDSFLAISGFNYVPITVYKWTQRTSGTTGVLQSVVWSGTQFVTVGLVGFDGIILTSPDAVTWTSRAVGNARSLFSVTWSGTQFVAVGDYAILTSPDGVTWTPRTAGGWLFGVTWSGTQFVAVGIGGTILTSPDGVTWTSRTSGTTNDLSDVTWSGTQFVAVGIGGAILTSPDGVTWTSRTSGTSYGLSGVTWSGMQFIVVGENGTILTSSDGITWTSRTSGSFNPLYRVSWSGTRFVVAGFGGTILTSPDGATWTSQTSGTVSNLYDVTWSGSQFVIAGDGGTILTSPF